MMIKRIPRHQDGDRNTIEVYSNLSMTLDRFFGVFLVLSALMLLVAVYPLVMGLWPVMVIAAVHIILVGLCFRSAWRGNWARQVIHFDPETVTIVHSAAKECWRLSWPVSWLRVQQDRDSRGEMRLYLEKSGERREIGAFLPPAEREELGEMLRELMAQRTAWTT